MPKNSKLFFLLILLISNSILSFAAKLDKKHDKHKPVNHSKNENNQPRTTNSPSQHHHSNSSSHGTANRTEMSHFDAQQPTAQTHLPIGWSLDKEQAKQHHNNPNGYALQHHEQQNHQQQVRIEKVKMR
jgi:hypothetical protein